jgi:hypothetical protein
MHYAVPLLSFAIPVALAGVQYAVPHSLAVQVEENAECTLPDDFNIQNFTGESEDDGVMLDSFKFSFLDDSTNVTSACSFNSSSKPIGDPGRTPRYACDAPVVQFIWQNGTLTIIEEVCPGGDGYVVSNNAEFRTS